MGRRILTDGLMYWQKSSLTIQGTRHVNDGMAIAALMD
jgi:hypothetical protein